MATVLFFSIKKTLFRGAITHFCLVTFDLPRNTLVSKMTRLCAQSLMAPTDKTIHANSCDQPIGRPDWLADLSINLSLPFVWIYLCCLTPVKSKNIILGKKDAHKHS